MRGCEMHITKIAALMAAVGFGLVCAPAAQAGFVNEAAREQKAAAATAASVPAATAPAAPAAAATPAEPAKELADQPTGRKVSQIGQRPADVASPRGKGRDIALGDMLPVIAPREFRIDMGNVDRQRRASWSGGKPWDAVLTDALMPLTGVEATIDWSQRSVTLHQFAIASVANSGTAATPAVSAQPAVAMRWSVRFSDVMLRQTLMRWAKDAGWQVSWDIGKDYPVQLEASFTGSFEDAVTQLMDSLRFSEYPALACLYDDNQVVRVLHYGDKKQCEK